MPPNIFACFSFIKGLDKLSPEDDPANAISASQGIPDLSIVRPSLPSSNSSLVLASSSSVPGTSDESEGVSRRLSRELRSAVEELDRMAKHDQSSSRLSTEARSHSFDEVSFVQRVCQKWTARTGGDVKSLIEALEDESRDREWRMPVNFASISVEDAKRAIGTIAVPLTRTPKSFVRAVHKEHVGSSARTAIQVEYQTEDSEWMPVDENEWDDTFRDVSYFYL